MGGEATASFPASGGQAFTTTHWSVVLRAGRGDSAEAATALEELCRTYWYPLYAFLRHQGHSAPDSQDLLQGFFARFLEKKDLEDIDQTKGRFRSFLLAALKHYLANQWDKSRAVKHGGRMEFLSLETGADGERCWEEPASELTPDKLYEQQWAYALLERVMARLEHEFDASGNGALFEGLKHFLLGESRTTSYADMATELGMSEGAVKMRVRRMRLRYQNLLRDEIAHTVARPEEVDEEIRYLFGVLSS